MNGPLDDFELALMKCGHVLVRETERYPIILMWLDPNAK